MAPSTTNDLRQAASEVRAEVLEKVVANEDVDLDGLYDTLVGDGQPEPAVRTAIWDLIAENLLVIRPGNKIRAVVPG